MVGRCVRRDTHHLSLAALDSGPYVTAAGWLMASCDATGDDSDHIRTERIQQQQWLGAG